jgi:adenosylhomocysteine nucleosidase
MNERVAQLVEEALAYRGYVTLRRSDGSRLVGFVYDRGPAHVELFDESATQRMRVPLAEIADIAFTGADTARAAQEIWERRKGTLESRETSAYGDWAEPAPLLVVVALERELRSMARALGVKRHAHTVRGRIAGSEVVAVAAGVGGEARQALGEERPRLLLSCGFAGGLDGALQTGDLVMATAVRDEAGNVLVPQDALLRRAAEALQGLRCRQGEILFSRQVAATAADKRSLGQRGALAVDMESYSAALAATEAGIPWLAVRVILDPLEVPLPPFTREAGSSYLGPALRYALSGPRAAADLFALAGRARRAGAALDEALRRLAPALAAPEARA